MKVFFRIFIVLLLCSPSLFAQERLTLDDAIAKALEYNFDIRISRSLARSAEVNNTPGNAGMLPNVFGTGNVTLGSANTHSEFVDGRVQEVDNAGSLAASGALNLNWTLFNGGKMFLVKKQLSILQDAGAIQLKDQIQKTVSQVIQAYAQVVWQKQQGVAIDTGLALAQVRIVLTQMQYESGLSAKVDFLQARVDYNARQSDSLNQVAYLNAGFASLNNLMGVDPFMSYEVDDSLRIDMNMQPEDPQRLEDVNLSIAYYKRSAEASKYAARAERADMLPVLGLTSAYNYTYSKSQAGFSLFNRSYGPTGGLTLNVPIFNAGNIRREAKLASLQAMRDQLTYEKQNNEISRQYRTAWRNYETSVAGFRLESQNIGYAKENKDIQAARFKAGIATTLETREAENSYVQALVRFYTAVYNVKVNETQVLELENQLVK
ncbi:MAG: TolC family protein [Sphingobacteriales bacterium]|nr:MAG: TolC family protein [Sphingobacteriales bacterium]